MKVTISRRGGSEEGRWDGGPRIGIAFQSAAEEERGIHIAAVGTPPEAVRDNSKQRRERAVDAELESSRMMGRERAVVTAWSLLLSLKLRRSRSAAVPVEPERSLLELET